MQKPLEELTQQSLRISVQSSTYPLFFGSLHCPTIYSKDVAAYRLSPAFFLPSVYSKNPVPY